MAGMVGTLLIIVVLQAAAIVALLIGKNRIARTERGLRMSMTGARSTMFRN